MPLSHFYARQYVQMLVLDVDKCALKDFCKALSTHPNKGQNMALYISGEIPENLEFQTSETRPKQV